MTAITGVAPPTAATKAWPARVFVGGVWLLMTLGMLAYVFHYGSNVPFFDDWHLVPVITGEQPVTLEWLWSQHGDHRVPLSRLLVLGLGKRCGYDFRCGMVFNVLELSATSLVLVGVSRRLRGRLAFADAFFPLLLLNPGQWEIFLWCWCVSVALPIALALLVLAVMARWGVYPSGRAVLVAGLLVLALPLTDPAGLAFVPALILWLAAVGVVAWRSPASPTSATRFLAPAFAVAAAVLLVVYHIGFTRAAGGDTRPGVPATLRTTIEFLSMGIGQASILIWPLSALVVLGLLASAAYVLGRTWLEQPADRSRVAALVFFFAGAGSLALALGWGRAGEGLSAGFKSRYVIMAVPVPCAVFVSWGCYRGRWRDVVQGGMCLLLLLLLPLNVKTAIDSADRIRPGMAAFEKDLRDGKPPSLLAERHTNVLRPWPVLDPDKRVVHEWLLMLQRAGVGPYRHMAADVPFHELPLSMKPESPGFSHAPIALDEPENVVAIRVRYAFAEGKGSGAGLAVYVQAPGETAFRRVEVVPVPPNFLMGRQAEETALAYVNHRIDQVRIEAADGSHPFTIYEVVLLVEDR